MKEKFYKRYFQDREPSIEDFLRASISRLDWVDMSLEISEDHNPRERIIINRLKTLIPGLEKHGIEVILVSADDLESHLENVTNKTIAVGGGLEDVCCEIRITKINESGGKGILDLSLTTKY